ncbi:MAG: citrate synthase [Natronomonas sp.]|jgi:citrate synthase
MEEFTTELSTYDITSITVRDRDLADEIMGELTFGGSVYLLWTGEEPTDGQARLVDAMLSSLMVHGRTPHALAARLTYLSEPESLQGAVASGLLGVGSQFVGSMQEAAAVLQELADEPHSEREAAVEAVVAEYRERGDPFPGIGHPFHEPVDPRAERLFAVAEQEGVAGVHIDRLREVQAGFEAATGLDLPVNITGAIAAVASDMGLSPEAARGLAVVSRAAGLVAAVIEEQSRPVAMDVWDYAEEQTEYTGEE